jgi:hypothetical protein
VALVRTDVVLRSVFRLLATAIVVSSSKIFFHLDDGRIRSSDTSVLATATRRNDILQSHRRENLKSYIALTGWAQ